MLSNFDFFYLATAVVEEKMATAAQDPDTPPHPLTLIHSCCRQWPCGHTFLIVDRHGPIDRVLTLKSNKFHKCDNFVLTERNNNHGGTH